MNETSASHAIAALAALALVWSIGYLTFARPVTLPSDNVLEEITRSEDFRLGARDIGPDQCLALPYQDPEIILIGSSHLYAGINGQVLEAESALRTGLCGLPRWNSDTLLPFMKYLDAKDLRPNRIVWLMDPASLLIHQETDEKRLKDANQLFFDERLSSTRKVRWKSRQANGQPPLNVGAKDIEVALTAQREALKMIDVSVIDDRLRDNSEALLHRAYNANEKFVRNVRSDRNLSQFCEFLKANNIGLDLVGSPLPPRTMDALSYDPVKRENYIKDAIPCADRAIFRNLDEWGLDIRHYLNRAIKPDYDYSLWDLDEAEFEKRIENLSVRERVLLIDPDHLNGVGAEIFTRELVDALELK